MAESELLNSPRIKRIKERIAKSTDERERKAFLASLVKEIVSKLSTVTVSNMKDSISVDNFDEVTAALRNELSRANKPLMKLLEGLNLTNKEQTHVIQEIEEKAEKDFRSEFQPILIKRPRDRVEVINLEEIFFPDKMSVSNLREIKPFFDELGRLIEKTFNIPAPKVTVNPPQINIPETKIDIPEVDLDPIIKTLNSNLQKIKTNSVTRPLAVRLSDGQKWIKEIVGKMGAMQTTLAGFSDIIRLRGKSGTVIEPATSDLQKSPGTIVSGTKTVTTAGTAVRIIATSTPCRYVWLNGDLGNTGGVLAVGDSSVDAIEDQMQGLIIIGGNLPVRLEIDNLNKLWVDAQTNGDKLSYAYTV